MRIAVGSDHRGSGHAAEAGRIARPLGHEVIDVGSHGHEDVDYPDVALVVARKVGDGEVDRGILICGSGLGMCIAPTKSPASARPPATTM